MHIDEPNFSFSNNLQVSRKSSYSLTLTLDPIPRVLLKSSNSGGRLFVRTWREVRYS